MTEPRDAGVLNPVDLENAIQEISRRARDLARTLEKEQSGLQSINSNVRAMFNAERGFGG